MVAGVVVSAISWVVAFTAGMVAAFNPCGIALLPSYLTYLLSGRSQETKHTWLSGFRSGVLMTVGFAVVFGIAGILVGSAGQFIFAMVPFASIALAVLLVVAAWLMLRREYLLTKWSPGDFVTKLSSIFRRGTNGSFIAYGISYGIISLTCSFPVFLAVVAQGISVQRMGANLELFFAYVVGMGIVIVLLSTVTVVTRSFVERFVRGAVPVIQKMSAIVMVGSAFYLLWYWVLGPGSKTLFLG